MWLGIYRRESPGVIYSRTATAYGTCADDGPEGRRAAAGAVWHGPGQTVPPKLLVHGGRNKRGNQLNDLWSASLDWPTVDWTLLDDGSDSTHSPEPRKGHTATMRPGPAPHLVSPLMLILNVVVTYSQPCTCLMMIPAPSSKGPLEFLLQRLSIMRRGVAHCQDFKLVSFGCIIALDALSSCRPSLLEVVPGPRSNNIGFSSLYACTIHPSSGSEGGGGGGWAGVLVSLNACREWPVLPCSYRHLYKAGG